MDSGYSGKIFPQFLPRRYGDNKEMGFMRQPLLILIIDLQDVFHQIRSHFFQWQGGSEQGHHFPLLVVNGLEIGGEQAPACYARNKVVL